MILIDFCPGDYIEYLREGGNPSTTFGVVVNEFRERTERFLKIATGYHSVEDFTSHQMAFDETPEGNTLSSADYHIVSERQVVKVERRYFVTNVVETKGFLGEPVFKVEGSPVQNILSELNDGTIYCSSAFSTISEETHTIPYSDTLLRYFQSSPDERKFINILIYDDTPLFDHEFDLYQITKVSDTQSQTGKYVHAFKDKYRKTFFCSWSVKLDIGNYLFLEKDQFNITEHPYTIKNEAGISEVIMLKWMHPKT